MDRSVVLKTRLDPHVVLTSFAMPDQEGIAMQDSDIRSGREVFGCA